MRHTIRPFLAVSALLIALSATPARGADISVGSDPGCDYADLDDAISAASFGDTLRLKAETFTDLITIDRSIDLIGGHTFCSDTSPTFGSITIIENPPAGFTPVVTVSGTGTEVGLTQITIQGANSSTDGGGIYVDSFAELELTQVVVRDNEAASGGGIYIDQNATLTTGSGNLAMSVVDNVATVVGGGVYIGSNASVDLAGSIVDISGNTADNTGGGIYSGGSADISLTNATISSNTSLNSSGGGLYSGPATGDATITIADSTFDNNSSNFSGGGLFVLGNFNGTKQFEISDSTIASNSANSSGGGLSLAGSLEATLIDTTIEGNVTDGSGGGINSSANIVAIGLVVTQNTAGSNGGGLHTTGSGNATLFNTSLRENAANGSGGGIYRTGSGRLSLSADMVSDTVGPNRSNNIRGTSQCDPSTLDANRYCSELIGNTASEGGGIFIDWSTQDAEPHRINHTAFLNNSGDLGAALTLHNAYDTRIETSLFAGNSDAGEDEIASVVHVTGESEVLFDQSTIADNSETGLVILADSGTAHNIYRNILWNNSGDFTAGAGIVVENQCNLSQDNTLPGVAGEPSFISTARGNYRLSDLSDALDRNCGAPVGVDLDGVSRPVGAHNDLGAFEGAWGHPDFLFSDRFEG